MAHLKVYRFTSTHTSEWTSQLWQLSSRYPHEGFFIRSSIRLLMFLWPEWVMGFSGIVGYLLLGKKGGGDNEA